RGPQIFLLILGRYVNVSPRDRSVLTGTYVELPDHAHLQVLGRRDVTVPEVGPRVWRQVIIGNAAANVDRPGRIRHAVIERRCVGVAVEVDGVLLEQVRPHDHADVAEGQEKLVILIKGN